MGIEDILEGLITSTPLASHTSRQVRYLVALHETNNIPVPVDLQVAAQQRGLL